MPWSIVSIILAIPRKSLPFKNAENRCLGIQSGTFLCTYKFRSGWRSPGELHIVLNGGLKTWQIKQITEVRSAHFYIPQPIRSEHNIHQPGTRDDLCVVTFRKDDIHGVYSGFPSHPAEVAYIPSLQASQTLFRQCAFYPNLIGVLQGRNSDISWVSYIETNTFSWFYK